MVSLAYNWFECTDYGHTTRELHRGSAAVGLRGSLVLLGGAVAAVRAARSFHRRQPLEQRHLLNPSFLF